MQSFTASGNCISLRYVELMWTVRVAHRNQSQFNEQTIQEKIVCLVSKCDWISVRCEKNIVLFAVETTVLLNASCMWWMFVLRFRSINYTFTHYLKSVANLNDLSLVRYWFCGCFLLWFIAVKTEDRFDNFKYYSCKFDTYVKTLKLIREN